MNITRLEKPARQPRQREAESPTLARAARDAKSLLAGNVVRFTLNLDFSEADMRALLGDAYDDLSPLEHRAAVSAIVSAWFTPLVEEFAASLERRARPSS